MKFIVESPLKHDGKHYEPGAAIEMSEQAASPLLKRGRLKKPAARPAAEDKKTAGGGKE